MTVKGNLSISRKRETKKAAGKKLQFLHRRGGGVLFRGVLQILQVKRWKPFPINVFIFFLALSIPLIMS